MMMNYDDYDYYYCCLANIDRNVVVDNDDRYVLMLKEKGGWVTMGGGGGEVGEEWVINCDRSGSCGMKKERGGIEEWRKRPIMDRINFIVCMLSSVLGCMMR